MAEKENATLSNAAQGAQTGYQVGGVYGAIAGAIIGGVLGASIGQSQQRARIYMNRAKKTERAMGYMEAAVQRRDMLRNARMARAESLAASSAGCVAV